MRVITGTARGKKLLAPEGNDVRPTPERVKEGIFSAIQFDIEGRKVLDLFAGSGQLGIEALSRGAGSAVFVDSSKDSLNLVEKNLENCNLRDKAKTVRGDYTYFTSLNRDKFDIAFLDPPYKAGLLEPAIRAVCDFMSDYGIIICEHPQDVKLPEKISDFSISKVYRYGKVLVTFYRKEVNA
ncbi:MAG: 16S rRNA (guanine(966)-N(2))-methyltransferase RsmD [Clostridia bacterium]|nr:16S rRNA (guanine(966)-N(2))-methyltransferase RsmD [Clostridia bacterium]